MCYMRDPRADVGVRELRQNLSVYLPRALRRAKFGAAARRRAREILARIALVDIDRRALAAAAAIDPPTMPTLDAIHLATALALREDLAALVTYDRRLAVAAERADLHVQAPV